MNGLPSLRRKDSTASVARSERSASTESITRHSSTANLEDSPQIAANTAAHTAAGGPERRRAPRACDVCHQRKIKCNGENPCPTCLRAGLACTYDKAVRRKNVRVNYLEALELRALTLTRMLASMGVEVPPLDASLAREGFGKQLMEAARVVHGTASMPVALSSFAANAASIGRSLPQHPKHEYILPRANLASSELYALPTPQSPMNSLPPAHHHSQPAPPPPHSRETLPPIVALTQQPYAAHSHSFPHNATPLTMGQPTVHRRHSQISLRSAVSETPSTGYIPHSAPPPPPLSLADVPRISTFSGAPFPPTRCAEIVAVKNNEDLGSGIEPAVPCITCEIHPELVFYFFDSVYNTVPIFHRQWFLDQMMPTNRHSPLLLMSIYAISSHLAYAHGDLKALHLSEESVDVVFANVIRMTPFFMDKLCLSTVQAFVIMTAASLTKGDLYVSWLYQGLALQFAKRLGLDHEDPCDTGRVPWVNLEMRRRTWWMVFNADRWMCTRIQRPLFNDENGTTQVVSSPELYFQSMDSRQIITLDHRLPEQCVPFHQMTEYLAQYPTASLGGFASITLASELYGRAIKFIRAASERSFDPHYIEPNLERRQILTGLHTLFRRVPTALKDISLVKTGQPAQEYFITVFIQIVNFCEMVTVCPVLCTMDISKILSVVREPCFQSAMKNADQLVEVSRKIMHGNPTWKGFSMASSVWLFYAALVYLAAVVSSPHSPSVPHYLDCIQVCSQCLRQISKYWSAVGRYEEGIRNLCERHGLLSAIVTGETKMSAPPFPTTSAPQPAPNELLAHVEVARVGSDFGAAIARGMSAMDLLLSAVDQHHHLDQQQEQQQHQHPVQEQQQPVSGSENHRHWSTSSTTTLSTAPLRHADSLPYAAGTPTEELRPIYETLPFADPYPILFDAADMVPFSRTSSVSAPTSSQVTTTTARYPVLSQQPQQPSPLQMPLNPNQHPSPVSMPPHPSQHQQQVQHPTTTTPYQQ